MIKRENKLLITFHTTTQAMAMEDACRSAGLPGRLIPVPASISAGCGLAWCADPGSRPAFEALMTAQGIACQEIHLCLI